MGGFHSFSQILTTSCECNTIATPNIHVTRQLTIGLWILQSQGNLAIGNLAQYSSPVDI